MFSKIDVIIVYIIISLSLGFIGAYFYGFQDGLNESCANHCIDGKVTIYEITYEGFTPPFENSIKLNYSPIYIDGDD